MHSRCDFNSECGCSREVLISFFNRIFVRKIEKMSPKYVLNAKKLCASIVLYRIFHTKKRVRSLYMMFFFVQIQCLVYPKYFLSCAYAWNILSKGIKYLYTIIILWRAHAVSWLCRHSEY